MTYIPVALRQLIYEQAEGRCEYCRIPMTPPLHLMRLTTLLLRKMAV